MKKEKEFWEQTPYTDALVQLIRSDMPDERLGKELEDYHERDLASTLEFLSQKQRRRLCRALGLERCGAVFAYVSDAGKYLAELPLDDAAAIVQEMDADDAVDTLEEVSAEVRRKLIDRMDTEAKEDIRLICSYDDEEIGSQMTTNFVLISRRLSVKQAMRSLVAQAEENDNISTLYVSDDDGAFYGAIQLKDLIVAREHTELESLISQSYPTVGAHEPTEECIQRLKEYAEDSIPVLNEKRHVIGVITAQDIVEAVDDEMADDYAKLAGLTAEEDLNETLAVSMKKRMPWLIVLLLLGMVVSTVVGMFEAVVAQVALIVCFQSLILDMAGNVGTQSLAVTIRVLMDEHLEPGQKWRLIGKEMRVGFCNGLVLGLLSFVFIGLYVWLFKGKALHYAFCISGCVGVALLVAMVVSSMVGTAVPMFFHKMKIDPAVASGPLITTVNDLVAVVTYYGLAWILLIRLLKLV